MIKRSYLFLLRNYVLPEALKNNLFSGTALDFLLSSEGGMPKGEKFIVYGGPGTGKSTIMMDLLANMLHVNPDLKVLYISSEMTARQLMPFAKRFPKFYDIPVLFVGNSTGGAVGTLKTMEDTLAKGWDVIVFDSFETITRAIRFEEHIAKTAAQHRLLSIMDKQCEGMNEREIHSTVFAIQQATKAGSILGANTIAHAFSATVKLELENPDSPFSERFITCPKNRYGANLQLFYDLSDGEDVWYDVRRYQEDIESIRWRQSMIKSKKELDTTINVLFSKSLLEK